MDLSYLIAELKMLKYQQEWSCMIFFLSIVHAIKDVLSDLESLNTKMVKESDHIHMEFALLTI